MIRPSYLCDDCRTWHVLAYVVEYRPALYRCLDCDTTRQTPPPRADWPADLAPLDVDARNLLGTWRLTA